ncbi:hypothetical protein C3433_27115 [Citrobacter freundii]|nr:hypothetical protein C3433_27115 [Citrobacter freundii]
MLFFFFIGTDLNVDFLWYHKPEAGNFFHRVSGMVGRDTVIALCGSSGLFITTRVNAGISVLQLGLIIIALALTSGEHIRQEQLYNAGYYCTVRCINKMLVASGMSRG